jgi:anti-sigma factor RsiW
MDHDQYIREYLSAQADGELSAQEQALVAEHLRECASCRALQTSEQELKARLRRHLQPRPAPADLRAKLMAAIEPPAPPLSRRSRPAMRWIPWAAGAVLALAAILVIAVSLEHPPNQVLAMAESGYKLASANFTPNVANPSPKAVAAELTRQTGVPIALWDFSHSGMKLVGSRLVHSADGRFIIYTLYRGPTGTILCILTPRAGLHLPPAPGVDLHGAHQLYDYHGLTVAVTKPGSLLCLLVTKMPLHQMMAVMQAAGA